jgi:hypothetical protein
VIYRRAANQVAGQGDADRAVIGEVAHAGARSRTPRPLPARPPTHTSAVVDGFGKSLEPERRREPAG